MFTTAPLSLPITNLHSRVDTYNALLWMVAGVLGTATLSVLPVASRAFVLDTAAITLIYPVLTENDTL